MKRVVIVGGGFAGTTVAKKLEKKFHVTLIDTKTYFEYTPGVLRILVESNHLTKIRSEHKNYLKNSKVIIGSVSEVTPNHVLIENKKIPYDYLVLNLGSTYNLPFSEDKIIRPTKGKTLENVSGLVHRANSILLIGGGLVGVELAGELTDKYKDKEIMIAHSKTLLIERNHKRASNYAKKRLEKRGVKLLLDDCIQKNDDGVFTTKRGNVLHPDVTFLCTGIKPNSSNISGIFSKMLNERGHVRVNSSLLVQGFDNIFSAGDVNSIKEEKTAQNAGHQGRVISKNIKNLEEGSTLINYQPKKRIMLISLGKRKGILSCGDFVINGWFPALLKNILEKLIMHSYK